MTVQLRMTVWPGQPIPLPEVPVHDLEVREVPSGTWFVLDGNPRMVELPVDFYLREPLEVPEVEHDGAARFEIPVLAEFASRWGRFSDPLNRDLYRVRGDLSQHQAQWAARYGWLRPGFEDMTEARRTAAVELGIAAPEDLGGGIANLRKSADLTDLATARLVNPIDVHERLWQARVNAEVLADILAGRDADTGWLPDVVSSLNEALTVFSVRVMTGGHSDRYLPVPSAYSVAALQAANDIADHVALQVCANEKCGRNFTRQRGRANYGEYRTKGVKFCSKSCALAQTQRERRRRVKAQEKSKVGG